MFGSSVFPQIHPPRKPLQGQCGRKERAVEGYASYREARKRLNRRVANLYWLTRILLSISGGMAGSRGSPF
jgi:hypothetical protein